MLYKRVDGRRGGGGVTYLVNTAKKVSPFDSSQSSETALQADPARKKAEERANRFALQALSREMLPNERVACCLRHTTGGAVGIWHDVEHKAAHYQGLQTCGSVWHDAVCAAKISERRRGELDTAISLSDDRQWAVHFATYTFSHNRYTALSESLHAFQMARKQFNQGKTAQRLKGGLGIIGTVSVLEVTWSQINGFHPHYHELIFSTGQGKMGIDEYGERARTHWELVASRQGLSMNERGYDLKPTFGAVQDYVAKFGREPLTRPWGVEDEMSKGHLKRGRGSTPHYTPFALEFAILQGQDELIPIWIEYASGFKGHKQLNWSCGLKKQFGIGDKMDEQVAEEKQESAALLGLLTLDQWRKVLANDARVELLERADTGNWEQVLDFLTILGCL